MARGVIIEYDFAAMNGAELLFGIAKDMLQEMEGVEFTLPMEAKYLAEGNTQGGFASLLADIKSKKTALKAARDLSDGFRAQLVRQIPESITQGFANFVKALADKGVKVVISTRADVKKVAEAFRPLLSDNVVLYHETSTCYGSIKWDAWHRACVDNGLIPFSTVAVTGSGYGVRSALRAGLGAFAVVNDHVAYQDFTGTSEMVTELNGTTAKKLLDILRL